VRSALLPRRCSWGSPAAENLRKAEELFGPCPDSGSGRAKKETVGKRDVGVAGKLLLRLERTNCGRK